MAEWKMGGAKSPFPPLQKGEQNTVGTFLPRNDLGRTVRSVSAEKQPHELGNYRDSDEIASSSRGGLQPTRQGACYAPLPFSGWRKPLGNNWQKPLLVRMKGMLVSKQDSAITSSLI